MALTSQTALRADDLVESIGVNTHLAASTSAYGNLPLIEQSLAYLGVDHVRDQVPGPSPSDINLNAFLSIGSFTLNGKSYKTVFDLISGNSISVSDTYFDKLAPYVGLVEGPNEVNYVPLTYTTSNGTVLTGTAAADAFQQALYATVKGDPLLSNTAVLTFSLGPGGSYSGYGDVSSFADYANVHAYATAGVQPNYYLTAEINGVTIAPSRPYIITETGNFTEITDPNGVSDDVQAKLEENILLDAFKMGVKQTYLYELIDSFNDPNNTDHEYHYGLFNNDGTPKPAALMIHDLTTILGDSANTAQSFTTAPLTYSVDGLPGTGEQMLLEKSNGTYDIALWQEPSIWDPNNKVEYKINPSTVTVTLGGTYQTINVYDLLVSTVPIATYHNVSSIQVALGSSALIVEVLPNVATVSGISTGSAGGAFSSTGADNIIAGSGAATVNVSGAATITGSSGTLAVNFNGSTASVTGDTGALTVTSNSGSNTVVGGSGAFSYVDYSANDAVTTGSSSSNTVVLGSGSDTVTVLGIASVTGGSGASKINLTGTGASVTGGSGALTVADTGGSNTVTGGSGAFTYTDAGGNDLVTTGTSTTNTVMLGGGNDTVKVLAATVLNSGTSNALVTLYASGSTVTGGSGSLSVLGAAGSNTIIGGSGTLTVVDNKGSNVITSGTGALLLMTTAGSDTITTNNTSGSSSISLGAGRDTVTANGATFVAPNAANAVIKATGALSVNGGSGSMTVTGSSSSSDYVYTQLNTKNVINLGGGVDTVLSHGSDLITASSASGAAAELVFTVGATSIIGGAGPLTVISPDDAGSIIGVTSVNGGSGSMTIYGGAGGDYVFTQSNTTNLINLGAGSDLVLSHGTDTVNASTVSGAAGEQVFVAATASITGGAGTLFVNGPGTNLTVKGGVGAITASELGNNSYAKGGSGGGNVLNAAGGNVTLVGGGAGDRLSDNGSVGNNLLTASAGGATLTAAGSNDTLTGGGGTDAFIVTATATNNTVIKNFQTGTDHLSFTGFNSSTPIASQQVVSGSLQLTLTSHATVTLAGVTSLS